MQKRQWSGTLCFTSCQYWALVYPLWICGCEELLSSYGNNIQLTCFIHFDLIAVSESGLGSPQMRHNETAWCLKGKRVSEQHVVPNMYCRWHYSHCHYSVFSPSCMYTTPTHTHSHDLIFLYWLQGSTVKVNTPAVGKASDDDNLAKGKVRRSTHHHKCTSSVVICIILYNRHITSNYCAVCLSFIVIRLEQYSQETVNFIRLII